MANGLDLKKGAWCSHLHKELIAMRTLSSLLTHSSLDRHLLLFTTVDKGPNRPEFGQLIQSRDQK